MNNIDQLLKVLDEGAFITHEEMAALAKEVRALQHDAAWAAASDTQEKRLREVCADVAAIVEAKLKETK